MTDRTAVLAPKFSSQKRASVTWNRNDTNHQRELRRKEEPIPFVKASKEIEDGGGGGGVGGCEFHIKVFRGFSEC